MSAPTGWAALLTPYSAEETAERYQAVRDAEARRRAASGAAPVPVVPAG